MMRTLCSQTPRAILIAALLLAGQPSELASAGQKPGDKLKHIPKTIWNFDGGVFLETDGSLSENTCFRLAGHMADKAFFDNLTRIAGTQGGRSHRQKEI